jgi:hypothetical protein
VCGVWEGAGEGTPADSSASARAKLAAASAQAPRACSARPSAVCAAALSGQSCTHLRPRAFHSPITPSLGLLPQNVSWTARAVSYMQCLHTLSCYPLVCGALHSHARMPAGNGMAGGESVRRCPHLRAAAYTGPPEPLPSASAASTKPRCASAPPPSCSACAHMPARSSAPARTQAPAWPL